MAVAWASGKPAGETDEGRWGLASVSIARLLWAPGPIRPVGRRLWTVEGLQPPLMVKSHLGPRLAYLGAAEIMTVTIHSFIHSFLDFYGTSTWALS